MSLETFQNLSLERQEHILAVGIKLFSKNSYRDVSTEAITKACGISKGLLFHYFGSKKEFYFYCLNAAMERLVSKEECEAEESDFYGLLFSSMDASFRVCLKYPDEMHMVNMASRDASSEIMEGKNKILGSYSLQRKKESQLTLGRAIRLLSFKEGYEPAKVTEGLALYSNAILNQYLVRYQQMPDEFFKNREQIKLEMKEYLDMMLRGICKE